MLKHAHGNNNNPRHNTKRTVRFSNIAFHDFTYLA